MNQNKEVLNSILKTSQMGQTGIRAVQKYAVKSELKNELSTQLKEYHNIETEAQELAAQRGLTLEDLHPVTKAMSASWAKMNLKMGSVDSKIAAMMINGNTRGMVKGLKNAHKYRKQDQMVSKLGERLLKTEESNIKQMQGYL